MRVLAALLLATSVQHGAALQMPERSAAGSPLPAAFAPVFMGQTTVSDSNALNTVAQRNMAEIWPLCE